MTDDHAKSDSPKKRPSLRVVFTNNDQDAPPPEVVPGVPQQWDQDMEKAELLWAPGPTRLLRG